MEGGKGGNSEIEIEHFKSDYYGLAVVCVACVVCVCDVCVLIFCACALAMARCGRRSRPPPPNQEPRTPRSRKQEASRRVWRVWRWRGAGGGRRGAGRRAPGTGCRSGKEERSKVKSGLVTANHHKPQPMTWCFVNCEKSLLRHVRDKGVWGLFLDSQRAF
jgi:hypothetical protein